MPLLERIDSALRRFTNGEGQMRVPVEATDPDIVLADCAKEVIALRKMLAEIVPAFNMCRIIMNSQEARDEAGDMVLKARQLLNGVTPN